MSTMCRASRRRFLRWLLFSFVGLPTALMAGSVVVLNEIMYHPATNESQMEWVEILNQQAVDMDLSQWTLSGAVRYEFPEGTVLKGGAYLVIAANPAILSLAAGVPSTSIVGPFQGRLGNGGQTLELRNNSGRLLDSVRYATEGEWPVAPDGAGPSLAKRRANLNSSDPSSWTASLELGGTPGRRNSARPEPSVQSSTLVPFHHPWRYLDSNQALDSSWRSLSFDDANWSYGMGVFQSGTGELPAAANTVLPSGQTPLRFRSTFSFLGDPEPIRLQLRTLIDDGAIGYLNGVEVFRVNLPTGSVDIATAATNQVGIPLISPPINLPSGRLVPGTNVLAVEVHQVGRSATYPKTILDADPVAYWRLGERGTRAPDLASRAGSQEGLYQKILTSNLAQPGVRPTNILEGRFLAGFETNNGAVRFAGNPDGGNDVVVAADNGALSFSSGGRFTIEAWVNGPAVQEDGAAIVAKGFGGEEQYALDLVGGRYRFLVRSPDLSSSPATIQTTAGPDGTWQYLVATCDLPSGNFSLYINGKLQAAGTPPTRLLETAHEVSLGSRQQARSAYDWNFDGRLDEVAIYDRALSAGEIQKHFEAAFVPPSGQDTYPEDRVFGLELVAIETQPAEEPSLLKLNELLPGGLAGFWVELGNPGPREISTEGWKLQRFGPGPERVVALPTASLLPGEFLRITEVELGFLPQVGDMLALVNPDHGILSDATRVTGRVIGRFPDLSGAWLFPSQATPGSSNQVALPRKVVINEVQYHPHPEPAQPAIYTNLFTLPIGSTWKYQAFPRDLGSTWKEPDFADTAWPSGPAAFYSPAALTLPVAKGTLLDLAPAGQSRVVTAYFRSEFQYPAAPDGALLSLAHLVDDGAVFYLNGVEILRTNLPSTNILYGTLATRNVGTPVRSDAVILPGDALRQGRNVLAVEVHQNTTNSTDLAFGLEFSVVKLLREATPFRDPPESWVELHNLSDREVQLEGWTLGGGIDFRFPQQAVIPAGGYRVVAKDPDYLRALYPDLAVLGPFQGKLSAQSEHLVLRDPSGNPVDEFTYVGGGAWPTLSDGGGSSLERIDPRSDSSAPESWAASDESNKSAWQTYTWRGIAQPAQPGEPDLWHEFALGLVDGAGEVLIDDIHVIESPASARKELIQNGGFDGGSVAHWRFLGNHRGSRVEPDPQLPGNSVLHLVASGPAEYQGNQIETTLLGNAAIVNGREYEISMRARWLSGGFRLNSRLYFNRLAHTIVLPMPPRTGTPGAENSQHRLRLGPTFQGLRHFPVAPQPFEPVLISARISDPDGVGEVLLRYSVGGGSWLTASMRSTGAGVYQGRIPGQDPGALVQFYLSAKDTNGTESFAPAGGPNSRAMFAVASLQEAPLGDLHEFRLLMTPSDTAFLLRDTNTLSNELLGGTVIYDRDEVYYDVRARLKGSFVGRNVPRVGFHVAFRSDQPFRGVHKVVSIDRSQHALTGGVGEILAKQIANHAGGVPDMYDDITQFVAPNPAYSLIAGLRTEGFDNDFLDSQWNRGSDGRLYEVEVIRWNLATVDGKPESPKAVGNESGGTGYANLEMQDYGADPEAYRWFCLQVNQRTQDDYSSIIRANQVLGDASAAFDSLSEQFLDVNEWLRVMAYQQLVGPADAYFTGGAVHNFRVYVRPEDGRLLYLPWDWDSSFLAASSAGINGSGNIAKLLNQPARRRQFYLNLYEMIGTTFNETYVRRWAGHYGALAKQDFTDVINYVRDRAASVLTQLPTTTTFAITANGGNDFATNQSPALLSGTAPIQVASFLVNGQPQLVTWTSPTQWRMLIDLAPGENVVKIQGLDRLGNVLTNALDTIRIVNQGAGAPAAVVINEWMADNAGPDGIPDPADGSFQDWFELYNPNPFPVDLSGYHLTDTLNLPLQWTIPEGTVIAGRGFLRVWADGQPQQNGLSGSSDLHAPFQLSSGGEAIGLFSPDGLRLIHSVVFGPQIQNVSQGFVPAGEGSRIAFLETPTPSAPNSAARSLKLNQVTADFRGILIQWTSEPGRSYRVEFTDRLEPSAWTSLGTVVARRVAIETLRDPQPSPNERFYRVTLEP